MTARKVIFHKERNPKANSLCRLTVLPGTWKYLPISAYTNNSTDFQGWGSGTGSFKSSLGGSNVLPGCIENHCLSWITSSPFIFSPLLAFTHSSCAAKPCTWWSLFWGCVSVWGGGCCQLAFKSISFCFWCIPNSTWYSALHVLALWTFSLN